MGNLITRVAQRKHIRGGVLDIHQNPIDLAAVTFVFSQPLVEVWLWDVNADDNFVKLFVTTIFDKHRDSIKWLGLPDNKIGDEGVASLCEVLKHSHCIKDVDLDGNKYTNVGSRMLRELQRQKPDILIYYDQIHDDDVLDIYHSINLEAVTFVFSQPLVAVVLRYVNADDDFVKLFVTTIIDKHKHSIKDLSLSGNNIGDEGVASLCDVLKHSDCIEDLYLSSNNIGDEGVSYLCELVRHADCIKRLYLDDNNIGDEGVASLCELVKHSDGIKRLSLHVNRYTKIGKQKLSQLKSQKPHIDIFYLASSPTIPDHILDSLITSGELDMALLFAFGFLFDTEHTTINRRYRAVNQSGNVQETFTAKSENTLTDTLSNIDDDDYQTKLQQYQIVQKTQSASLASHVVSHFVSGRKLSISDIPLTLLDLAALAFACHFSQPLHTVSLRGVNADDNFVKLFVTTIFDRHKDSITNLWLNNNKIGDKGAASLGQSLKDSRSITRLSLSNNKIGDKGAASLGQSLKDSCSITELWLSNNKIGDKGAASLGQSLKDSCSITELWLNNNKIGDKGAASLGQALKDSRSITWLSLRNNNFTRVGRQKLAELERQNPRVTITY